MFQVARSRKPASLGHPSLGLVPPQALDVTVDLDLVVDVGLRQARHAEKLTDR
jgi:hypothetical protein